MAKANPGSMLNAAGVSYGELIRRQRKMKGLSQEELGSIADVGKNAVGAWEAGRSRPDLSSVPVICEALGLTITEFLGLRDGDGGDTRAFTEKFKALNDVHRHMILREMDTLKELEQAATEPVRKLVSLYRSDLNACAGPSLGLGEASGEEVWLYADPLTEKADEIIRVNGKSMEPTFRDGDEVLVKHTPELRSGEIGIFTNGDTGYIKEYRKDGLHSHNPAYPVMVFHEGDTDCCVGKVLGRLTRDRYASQSDIEAYASLQGT